MKGQTQIVPISGGFHVWTRKVGDSPIKILLLHGGPGSTHEYLLSFQDYLPQEGIEIYFYDQLGSYHSDQPNDPSLWNVERFREEVEEVRKHLDLDQFYLFGSSWGGFLGIEYALKYQKNLKGLIISNMTASIPSYVKSINHLRNKLPAEIINKLAVYEEQGNYKHPEYEKLLEEHLYKKHICRLDPWPDPVVRGLSNINEQIYNTMQGPNEFLVTGTFKDWDRWDNLQEITVPTLLLGGKYDTMAVEDKEEMGRRIPNSRVCICEKGSHLSMWDDADAYFDYIKQFIKDVEDNKPVSNTSETTV
ncbi:proline iminopeptidase-family hydrolase [Bacillus sp. S/N-304-OC-R1]|uniref:proline iminopeptidase-family hydrolase n=1 Tax=Bacillus sp. S/N-304-OC-R1 TaxID=2758034 RepID=UPI001C8D3F75|nr:proline iminopeptidase-family hydrolase [Bacillus sp. S/N-304-OC-R1]MBY0121129.1 proline iminopeptidase-family hydrolase [Bacillus sp. S/N-304-OC-R1]